MHELRDRTLVVLGLGAIGREVARLASAFGMRVIGVNRSGRNPGSSAERVIATGELVDVLPEADAGVVVTVPSTDATRGLLDAAALAALPRTAVVVNVGRGAVIDEPALIEALVAGRLAGAALDVFAQEPLPDHSPLWQLPNAILSPHTAALSPRENERLVDLFAANLRRYLDGRELINRVRVERGY